MKSAWRKTPIFCLDQSEDSTAPRRSLVWSVPLLYQRRVICACVVIVFYCMPIGGPYTYVVFSVYLFTPSNQLINKKKGYQQVQRIMSKNAEPVLRFYCSCALFALTSYYYYGPTLSWPSFIPQPLLLSIGSWSVPPTLAGPVGGLLAFLLLLGLYYSPFPAMCSRFLDSLRQRAPRRHNPTLLFFYYFIQFTSPIPLVAIVHYIASNS